MTDTHSQSYKLVFVGDTKVGKTSIINYYIKRDASPTTSTLGATSTRIETKWDNRTITMTVWDTAGQETFRNLVPVYAKGSHAAVIVFNQHSVKSWTSVPGWFEYLQTVENTDGLVLVLVANKSDKEAKVDMNEVYAWASGKNIEVVRTSAIQGLGVDSIFETVAKELAKKEDEAKEKRVEETKKEATKESVEINQPQGEKQKKKCC